MRIKKGIVFLCTLLVASLALISSALAYTGNITMPVYDVNKGDKLTFIFSVQPEADESLNDINYYEIWLSGPSPIQTDCFFNSNLSIIEGCNGMTIEKVDTGNYNVTIDTGKYVGGNYYLDIYAYTGWNSFFLGYANFNIIAKIKSMEGCSMRGKGGEVELGWFMNSGDCVCPPEEDCNCPPPEKIKSTNKLNFYVPLKNAAPGQGYLTSQIKRTRVSYNFRVIRVLENDDNSAVLWVYGKYRLGILDFFWPITGSSIIVVDKRVGTVSLKGNILSVNDMDITFQEKCK